MIERFEEFVSNIALCYKQLIKIKAYEMQEFGLKGAHAMCLFFIGKHEGGLTAVEICELCREDKAGISKSLAALKEQGYIETDDDGGKKKYRAKYKISKKGLAVYERISDIIVRAVAKCGKGLSDEERNTFYNSLDLIVSNMEEFVKYLESKKES